MFAALATAAVTFAIVWGFMLVGSPGTRRLERLDEQRLADLQAIAGEIQDLVVDREKPDVLKGPLPATLEALANQARSRRIERFDPDSGEPYLYEVTGESTYRLCATFTGPRDSDSSVFWNHPTGKHCFEINVLDPPPFY
jgi:hypothetical protein